MKDNCRYFRIGGITIEVKSDLPITDTTFHKDLELFRVDGPGEDCVSIHHHFELPTMEGEDPGREVYRKAPWAVYKQAGGWMYKGILPESFEQELWIVAKFNGDHSEGHIYHPGAAAFLEGNLHALTMFPSDQILVARLLAVRQGCYLHSAGAILNGKGFLFVGHSEAGKSTITQMLVEAGKAGVLRVEILCDDRNILRRIDGGWRVYGSWSHGDIPRVSPSSARLSGICFLQQAQENSLKPLTDRREINHRLLACVIKPLVSGEWWGATLDLLSQVAEVPCSELRFDKSGQIVDYLEEIVM